MKHITVIYPEAECGLNTVACIVGTLEMFSRANQIASKRGLNTGCQVVLAGTLLRGEYVNGPVTLHADTDIAHIDRTDLVIVPSAIPGKGTGNQPMLNWISRQYKNGAEVASMCSGAFILASAGIMEGRNCTTHWSLADKFREQYPGINLQSDRLITDENGIYTNGGAYSFLNLLIYLIEKYYDRQTAIQCAKVFQVEIDRENQSAFAIFSGQKAHGDELVRKAQAYIEARTDEKLSVEDLSAHFAIGRRNFDRRFIRATGNTPLEYAQRVKIEVAKKSLESTRKTVNEVMYEVGYSDLKAFREVFRRITGLSPLEYRVKYNKDGMAQVS